jgi:Protein of unknown function (DUF2950)
MKDYSTSRAGWLKYAAIALVATIFGALALHSQTVGQKTFASSKDAVDALVQAVRDNNMDTLRAIFGSENEAIISSGDEVADKSVRQKFLARYDTKHSLAEAAPHELTLNVGADDWPLPIPLVDTGGKWYFDGVAGKEEILYRRIGHNELAAIDVCKGVIDAQREYAASTHDGQPAGTYASRVVSEPGKQNGLFWEVKEGEPASPAGPMLAGASAEGYSNYGQRIPYHGYYYRMLKSPKGFTFLAYPAEYQSSGVMTFVADQTGSIYEKNLGDRTDDLAQHIDQFQKDDTWRRVK